MYLISVYLGQLLPHVTLGKTLNKEQMVEAFTVMQDAKIWQQFLDKDLTPRNNMTELYFEESDIEGFVKKLEESDFEIEYVNKLMTHSWGQKVVRFYDPDGNLIEVGTPMS